MSGAVKTKCSRCDSPEDKRYTKAVDALLNNGAVDHDIVRAFFEYVDGTINDDEMEYLVGGDCRNNALRPAVAERYGYGS